VRDNDGAYGHVFTSGVMAMGIRDRPISPASPWQKNGYVERLIGAVRRECLDRMLIFGESHLRQVLSLYAAYYNQMRTHLALGKDAPWVGRSSGPVSLLPSRSCPGCTTNTSGYDFRKGQGL
jgi:transposase InsO family protein